MFFDILKDSFISVIKIILFFIGLLICISPFLLAVYFMLNEILVIVAGFFSLVFLLTYVQVVFSYLFNSYW